MISLWHSPSTSRLTYFDLQDIPLFLQLLLLGFWSRSRTEYTSFHTSSRPLDSLFLLGAVLPYGCFKAFVAAFVVVISICVGADQRRWCGSITRSGANGMSVGTQTR